MDTVNSDSGADEGVPETDYSNWVAKDATPAKPPKGVRWCPTHMRYEECEPGKRLRCGEAWRELHEMEREVEAEKMSQNGAMLQLVKTLNTLIGEIQHGERIIAEPPIKPPVPQPNPRPRPNNRSGKGGVALP